MHFYLVKLLFNAVNKIDVHSYLSDNFLNKLSNQGKAKLNFMKLRGNLFDFLNKKLNENEEK